MKWIKVSDNQPDKYDFVLWYDPKSTNACKYFIGRLLDSMYIVGEDEDGPEIEWFDYFLYTSLPNPPEE